MIYIFYIIIWLCTFLLVFLTYNFYLKAKQKLFYLIIFEFLIFFYYVDQWL